MISHSPPGGRKWETYNFFYIDIFPKTFWFETDYSPKTTRTVWVLSRCPFAIATAIFTAVLICLITASGATRCTVTTTIHPIPLRPIIRARGLLPMHVCGDHSTSHRPIIRARGHLPFTFVAHHSTSSFWVFPFGWVWCQRSVFRSLTLKWGKYSEKKY